ncbi:MAG: hypothetical protein K5696_04410 [Lachnospiraceae bacterium]|nr:hypothetical protein [Lachnospiraceae bacterium]
MAQNMSRTMAYTYATSAKGRKNGLKEGFDTTFSEQEDHNTTDKESTTIADETGSMPAVATTGYSRVITASIRTQQMVANPEANSKELFSYQTTEQTFQVCIRNDGCEKKYTVAGTDENGEHFEREFDPYSTDLTDADYTEFSALCMYIRRTDDTADLIANEYFSGADIFEKKDFMRLMNRADTDSPFASIKKMMNSLYDLMDSLNSFMSKQMNWLQAPTDEMINALFIDAAENTDDAVSEENEITDQINEISIIRESSTTDPDTGESIPQRKMSITAIGPDCLSCKNYREIDGKWVEKSGWSIDDLKPGDYEKVQDFLALFDKDANLTFASQECFWRDYLDGKIDENDFREYYSTTIDGYLDFRGAAKSGESFHTLLSHPYARYFNNADFIGNVYTEEELQAMLLGSVSEATNLSTTQNDSRNPYESAIGLYSEGDHVYPVLYADDSTEDDPIICIGNKYFHINDIDPRNATKAELCALESYMNDNSMIPKTGRMRSYNRILSYAQSSGNYNGWNNGSDIDTRYDWIDILNRARMNFLGNNLLRSQAKDCSTLMEYLNTWMTSKVA